MAKETKEAKAKTTGPEKKPVKSDTMTTGICVGKGDLERAVAAANGSCGNSLSVPVIECALLKSNGDELSISATNLEIYTTVTIPCQSITPIDLCVPCAMLYKTVKALAFGEVFMHVEDNALDISCEAFSGQIQGVSPDEFPYKTATGEEKEAATVKAKDLIEAITFTAIATSEEVSRYQQSCVQMKVVENGLEFNASDTHRATRYTIPCETTIIPENDVALFKPHNVLSVLKTFDKDDDLRLSIDGNKMHITGRNASISVILCAGTMPLWGSVFSRDSMKFDCTVNAPAAMHAIRSADVFSNPDTRRVIMAVKDSRMFFSAQSQTGAAADSIAAECDEEIEVALNNYYLADFLKLAGKGDVTFSFIDDSHMMHVRIDDNPNVTHVIMPMRKD